MNKDQCKLYPNLFYNSQIILVPLTGQLTNSHIYNIIDMNC